MRRLFYFFHLSVLWASRRFPTFQKPTTNKIVDGKCSSSLWQMFSTTLMPTTRCKQRSFSWCTCAEADDGLLCVIAGWAHVVCALYIPEVEFANVSTMEPIVLQSVPHERYNKVTEPISAGGHITHPVSVWLQGPARRFSQLGLCVYVCVFVDVLHLRGPGQREQSSHWSLYDLQQAWLQTGLPCHMVRDPLT